MTIPDRVEGIRETVQTALGIEEPADHRPAP
jgi:hypothetical protein